MNDSMMNKDQKKELIDSLRREGEELDKQVEDLRVMRGLIQRAKSFLALPESGDPEEAKLSAERKAVVESLWRQVFDEETSDEHAHHHLITLDGLLRSWGA